MRYHMLFFILNIWDLVCCLNWKQISIQISHSSAVQQPYVTSGYYIQQHRYRQGNAKENTVEVLTEYHLSDRYRKEGCTFQNINEASPNEVTST